MRKKLLFFAFLSVHFCNLVFLLGESPVGEVKMATVKRKAKKERGREEEVL